MNISPISNIQAEAQVIATLIYHPEFILHTDYLKPTHFYNVENGCIYWAIQELYKSGIDTIDVLNISNMLNSNKAVKKKMSDANLSDLQEVFNLTEFAARGTLDEYKLAVNEVRTQAFKRELNKVASEFQSACFNEKINLGELNELINRRVSKLSEEYMVNTDIELYGSKVQELFKQIVDRRSKDGVYGLPSKFPALNEYFTYEPGELVLLKARMKQGKSAFMMNEAIHMIKMGIPTLYYDTEMQDRLFHERLLANLSGITVKNIKTGRYSYEEGQLLQKWNDWLEDKPFVHIYTPIVSDEEIYATHKILKYKMDLKFSVFDYIKSNVTSSSENYNVLGARCDFLKNTIAGDLNIAILAGAQLNRDGKVADSDKLERYTSVSVWWRNKDIDVIAMDGEDCGNYCATVDLNRLGEQMDHDEYLDFIFDGNRMRIEQGKQHAPLRSASYTPSLNG